MRATASLIVSAVLGLAACQTSSVTPPENQPFVCARDVQPPVAEPGESRNGGDVTAPVLIRRVEPAATKGFPSRATAVIEAVIGEDGVPRNVCLAAGDSMWGSIVVDAVRKWRFRPGTLDGKPVPVLFSVTATSPR